MQRIDASKKKNPAPYPQQIFLQMDEKRKELEDQIADLLAKCFGTNAMISASWRFRRNRILNGGWTPDQQGFFDRYAKELSTPLTLPEFQDLLTKIKTYRNIISDDSYILSQRIAESPKEIASLYRDHVVPAQNEEENTSKREDKSKKDHYTFFKDSTFSIHRFVNPAEREEASPRLGKK